ncbi:DUF6585 family protein [Streptomyces sp. NPDC102451]|uniref:DUF6585 family protein n=1 Tax=Streptomyces sp. NPDC102451 TaxID=3366177 RepID=UPI00382CE725
MTERDSRLRAQDQLLTRIDEAAERGRLGERRAVHRGVQSQSGSPGCALAAGAVFFGIALALFLAGRTGLAVIPFGLLLVSWISIGFERLTSKRNQSFQLDLYEHGLTAALKNRVHAVRYDGTSVLQNSVRHTGVAGYTEYEYTLTDIEGQQVVLRGRSDGVAQKGRFPHPKEWGDTIQQAVTEAQLPKAIARLKAGESLDFGRLWLTLDAVGSARDTAKWSQIQEIRVFDGFVKIKIAGQWRSLGNTAVTSITVSGIPNFFVFLALAERLRQSGSGTAV